MNLLVDIHRTADVIHVSTEGGTVASVEYRGDIIADVEISEELPDVFYGIAQDNSVTIRLANINNGVDKTWDEIASEEELRGCKVVLSRDDGTILLTGNLTQYTLGPEATITITPKDEIFETLLPKGVVCTDDFYPTALDIGTPIPICLGYCKNVPCANIQTDYVNDYYDYLIGYGTIESLWIDHANGRGIKRNGVLVDESEYTFEDGSQGSPYAGYAYIRFIKEQVGFSDEQLMITADVKGLELGGASADRNIVNQIKAVLNNATWGLNQSIDSTTFTTTAAARPVASWIGDYLIYDQGQARDVLNELLFACQAWLKKNDNGEWEITADGTDTSVATFGDNDGYYDNCEIVSCGITPADSAIKTGYVKYDSGQKRIELSCNTGFGIDKTYEIACVSEDVTAKKILSYIYGRSHYADKQLSLHAGEDAKNIECGDIVTVISAARGLSNVKYRVIRITRKLIEYTLDCEAYSDSIFDDQTIAAPTAMTESTATHALRIIDDATIAGMLVDAETIMTVDGLVGLSSAVTAGTDWRIWAGNAIPGDAPFRVDENGALFATNADISGTISASDGFIGGFVIDINKITDFAGLMGLSSLKTDGDDIRFWAGDVTPADAPFYVKESGILVAKSATIMGDITAETGYFDTVTLGKSGVASGTLILQINAGQGDTYIAAGKSDFSTVDMGFILGIDDSDSDLAKFYIGNSTQFFYWDGAELVYNAGLVVEPIIQLYVSGEIRTSETALDGTALSFGVLIDETGFYAAGPNQNKSNANVRILAADGSAYFKGDVVMDTGYIGGEDGWKITSKIITGAADSKIISGILESSDWSADAGAQISLLSSTMKFGGSSSPKFEIAADGTFSAVGGVFKTTATGPRVEINADGIIVYMAGISGKYNEFIYNDGIIYGTGALAIGNPSRNVPIYFGGDSAYGDIHLYNRSAVPSGAAEIGDICVVGGALNVCSAAGTPGTWASPGIAWSIITANTNAEKNNGYICDTSGGAFNLTLLGSPSEGDIIAFRDGASTFDTANLTIARNGLKIMGLEEDMTVNMRNASVELIYSDAANGWRIL